MFTSSYWLVQLEFMLRLMIAGVCGGFIGYERKSRGKEAGLRTHIIVAVAAALMMIISKYGFSDLDSGINGMKGADGSRIASQIVTGVGFLGAGMIFVHKNTIKGLTTAAGIWATSGIGMAVGAGMYVIGIISTAIIVFFQIVLHKDFKFLKSSFEQNIALVMNKNFDTLREITEFFGRDNIHIENMSVKEAGEKLKVKFEINTDKEIFASDIIKEISRPEDLKVINCSK